MDGPAADPSIDDQDPVALRRLQTGTGTLAAAEVWHR
jgi:hypothetical protein